MAEEKDHKTLKAPKKKKAPAKKRKFLDRVTFFLRAAAFTCVGLFVFSILWAGVYRFVAPPGTMLMAERKLGGVVIIHPWAPLSEISPHLVTAVIAAEDTRFCLHNGIDFEAIDKAMGRSGEGQAAARRLHHIATDRQERIFMGPSQLGAQRRRSLDDRVDRNGLAQAPRDGSLP